MYYFIIAYKFFTLFIKLFTYLYLCLICISSSMVQHFEHFHVIALYKLNIIIIITSKMLHSRTSNCLQENIQEFVLQKSKKYQHGKCGEMWRTYWTGQSGREEFKTVPATPDDWKSQIAVRYLFFFLCTLFEQFKTHDGIILFEKRVILG